MSFFGETNVKNAQSDTYQHQTTGQYVPVLPADPEGSGQWLGEKGNARPTFYRKR